MKLRGEITESFIRDEAQHTALLSAREPIFQIIGLLLGVQFLGLLALHLFIGGWLTITLAGGAICICYAAITSLLPGSRAALSAAAISLQLMMAIYSVPRGQWLEPAIVVALHLVMLAILRDEFTVALAFGVYFVAHIAQIYFSSQVNWIQALFAPQFALLLTGFCIFVAGCLRRQTLRLLAQEFKLSQLSADLERAQFAAETASRTKSEILANLSHEIRTPMNGVLGMTRLLMDTRLTGEQRELTHTLDRSTKALLDVVNGILDFSAIDAGKLSIEKNRFAFGRPFEDVLELLGPMAHGKGIELLLEQDSRIPLEVIGDSRRIRQVLVNLVGNALKFTQHGHVLIETNLDEDKDNGRIIRVDVVDTGPGVAPEDQSRLFQPFSQANTELVRRHGGTGLGLAISKRLVEAMGGDIGLQSLPGKGARFWFTFHLDCIKNEQFFPPDIFQNKRAIVLCVNSQAAQVVAAQLRQWGIDSFPSPHIDAVVAELMHARQRSKPYDFVLLEGDRDGSRSTTAWHKRIQTVDAVPVIGILPLGNWNALDENNHSGFAGLLTKPLRPSQLETTVRNLIYPESRSETPEPAVVPVMRHNRKILLVEDNAVNQKVAGRLIQKLGYEVTIVNNGKLAVEAMRLRGFALIFMDCMMPEMDGFEATAIIREMETSTHTPIIAMTAYALQGDRERCLAAGMDDYLSKPVKFEELAEVVERWAPLPQPNSSSAAAGD